MKAKRMERDGFLMHRYQKLDFLPLGSITPGSFLKEQLLRNKEGIGGHLDELEPGMIADPFVNKSYVPAWGDGDQSGWGAEISGNYWAGLIGLAFTLQDAELIKKAENWVNGVLKNQKPDGYLGTYYEEGAAVYEDYNAWGTACGMRALLFYYDATKREEVLDAVYRCMLWFCERWAGDKKTSYAGSYLIDPMIQCYFYTGDGRLVRFCEEYLDFLNRHDLFHCSVNAFLRDKLQYNSNHTSAYGIQAKLPALVYAATGKNDYLEASRSALRKAYEKATHLSGGPVCNTEYLGPVSASAETEYCAMTFFQSAYAAMTYVTGEAAFGDRIEEIFYNAAQGARKKDEKAIAYLSAPNQIFATDISSACVGDMQVYAPCYPTSCCPVNAVGILPEFVRSMAMKNEAGDIFLPVYGPCTIRTEKTEIREKTLYPFRNRVELEISGGRFKLHLKIPGWCESWSLRVNGAEVRTEKGEDGYVALARAWEKGDTVCIDFETAPVVVRADDREAGGKHPLAIRFGALLFSLPIREEWTPVQGRPVTPLPEGWSWYHATPAWLEEFTQKQRKAGTDPHEAIGKRLQYAPWHAALDENLEAGDIRVIEQEEQGYAWSHPMVKLVVPGYQAPYAYAPYISKTPEPYGQKQVVTEKRELELVPYGCTNLRITYFPRADL